MELTIEEVLQQGIVAHKEGRIQDAERLYKTILKSHPLHPDANHNLGLLALLSNKADTSLLLFKTALEANPKIEQFWLSYIDTLIKENDLESAKKALEECKISGFIGDKLDALEDKLLRLNDALVPTHVELKNLLNYYQNKRFDDAEKLAEAIIKKFPNNQFSWKVLGVLYGKKGMKHESLNANQKSVQLAPNDAEAHFVLGNAFKERGEIQEAEKSFTQALYIKPDFAEAHNNLGIIFQELNRFEEAELCFRKAIDFKLNFPEAHNNLANTVKEQGRFEEAEVSYKQAIIHKPEYAKAYFSLGNILQEQGRFKEAEASHVKLIALKPDFAPAYNNLGISLKEQGRLGESELSYLKAIALKPDYADAHNNLGNMLREQDRLKEAEASFRQAISFKVDFAEAYSNLGYTLHGLARLEEAEECYNKSLTFKPDYAETHNNLGVTLRELNRLDEAEASFSQAIKLKPDFYVALMNRWQLLFDRRKFEDALRDADSCNTEVSRVCGLETLFALGRIDEIYKRIEIVSDLDDKNIRMAAFSSFISEREKKNTAHKFCQNPIPLIHFKNISSHVKKSNKFITELIDELNNIKTTWEPSSKTTHKGFQTSSDINLFLNPSEKMMQLKSIIIDEIEAYYLKFRNHPCSYIKNWPSKGSLLGWHVVLKQQGFQSPHIHPSGWLSGVIYLKVVPPLGKNEGAIEFSLNNKNYSDLNASKLIHQPKLGDMVFFPSSLPHRTIPFTTDKDRITISFDLMPKPRGV